MVGSSRNHRVSLAHHSSIKSNLNHVNQIHYQNPKRFSNYGTVKCSVFNNTSKHYNSMDCTHSISCMNDTKVSNTQLVGSRRNHRVSLAHHSSTVSDTPVHCDSYVYTQGNPGMRDSEIYNTKWVGSRRNHRVSLAHQKYNTSKDNIPKTYTQNISCKSDTKIFNAQLVGSRRNHRVSLAHQENFPLNNSPTRSSQNNSVFYQLMGSRRNHRVSLAHQENYPLNNSPTI